MAGGSSRGQQEGAGGVAGVSSRRQQGRATILSCNVLGGSKVEP